MLPDAALIGSGIVKHFRKPLVIGGLLGSVVGVLGASISDPAVGFPAWVDLTGIVAGFGVGPLATGLGLLVRHGTSLFRRQSNHNATTGEH